MELRRPKLQTLVVALYCSVALGALFLSAGAPAQPLQRNVTCGWGPPEHLPNPLDHYRLQLQTLVGDSAIESETFEHVEADSMVVTLDYGFEYRVRVSAVDVDGRVGPWSLWSRKYSPDSDLDEHITTDE